MVPGSGTMFLEYEPIYTVRTPSPAAWILYASSSVFILLLSLPGLSLTHLDYASMPVYSRDTQGFRPGLPLLRDRVGPGWSTRRNDERLCKWASLFTTALRLSFHLHFVGPKVS